MIDQVKIRQTIRAEIITTGLIDASEVAWQNVEFDPTGKTLWYRETWYPITDAPNTNAEDVTIEICQLDIVVPKYDSVEAVEDEVKRVSDLFSWGTEFVNGTIRMVVDENRRGRPVTGEKWYWIPLQLTIRAIDAIT